MAVSMFFRRERTKVLLSLIKHNGKRGVSNRIALYCGFIALTSVFLAAPATQAQPGQQPIVTAASDPRDVSGIWQGIWKRADGDTRIVVKISKLGLHGLLGRLYLVDKPGLGMNLYRLKLQGTALTYSNTIEGVSGNGSYRGELTPDGDTIVGFWTESAKPQELDLRRMSGVSTWEPTAPTTDQLHRYLDTSFRRSLLIGEHAAPFHLVARLDVFDNSKDKAHNPAAQATLDELWRDPLHWKLSVAYGAGIFTEIDDGGTAYTIGNIAEDPSCCNFPGHTSIEDVVLHAEAVLFSPFRPALLSTRRLTLDAGNCIDAEPELAGVPSTVPIASAVYCPDPYDLILHHAEYPKDSPDLYRFDLSDVAPFDGKDIARTIDIWRYTLRLARLSVTTLEPATDFSALSAPAPLGAKRGTAHSQNTLLADELMRGHPLTRPGLESRINKGSSCCIYTAELNLHVDVSGKVTGYSVVADPGSLINPSVIEGAMQIKFSLGYQGDHPVPFDYYLVLWSSTP